MRSQLNFAGQEERCPLLSLRGIKLYPTHRSEKLRNERAVHPHAARNISMTKKDWLITQYPRRKKEGGTAKVRSYTVKSTVAICVLSTPLKLYTFPLIVIVPEYVP